MHWHGWLRPAWLVALVACTGTTPDAPSDTPEMPQAEPLSPETPGSELAPDADGGGVDDAEADGEAEADVEAVPAPLTVRLQDVGPAGVVPAQVIVHVDQPFFKDIQTLPESNRMVLSPPVEGQLERFDAETVAFIPTSGFAPGTEYTATLEALDNGAGPREGAWTHVFTTPPFGLVRASLHQRDLETGLTEVDLIFSAPISVSAVQQYVRLTVGQLPIEASVLPGDRLEEARFRFQALDSWGEDAELEIVLDEGVSWSGSDAVTASADRLTLPLRLGPPVEILATQLKEGMSGFYLDIVCRDAAVPSERYYWDEDTWDGWWVSSRCMLSQEQLQSMVRVSPATELTIAPAGAGFRLFGDFSRGDYTLEIDAGARTIDGGALPAAYTHRFSVGKRSPRVQFASKGRYLPQESWDQLAVRHLNQDAVALTIRHVPPQNVIFWMSGDSESATDRSANVVFREDVALSSPPDDEVTTWLDVGRMLPEAGQGVYELTLEGIGSTDVTRLMLTDLQLVAKRATAQDGSTQVWAWVLDAHNNAPVLNVEVSVVLPSGRRVAECTTPLDGGCLLEIPDDPLSDASPMAIIAERGQDMTYLKFSELELSPASDVSGLPYRGSAAYHAALMTERGVYRPGETVHLSMVARGEAHTAPEAPLPVVLKIYDARGRELRRLQRVTNEVGVLTEDIALSDFAVTGRYRITAEAGERTLGAVTFRVEEFVPERMSATVQVLGDGVRPAESSSVAVYARWLFGGSAVGSRVELTCSAEPAAFTPETNADYHYGPAALEDAGVQAVVIGVIEGMLDDEGRVGLSCPPAGSSGASLGAGRLVARAAVFEGDSGRSTVETATSTLHPEDYYIGLRASVDALGAGQQATIDGVVVGWDGAVSDAISTLSVDVFRLEEEVAWVWDENTGDSRRRSQLRRIREGEQEVTVQGGRFQLPFTPPADAAGYLLVAQHGGALTELHIPGEGRRYWWEPGRLLVDQTPRPERPAPLEIRAPEALRIGEEVAVSVVAPYDGQILWAVETDGLVHSEWQDVRAGAVDWSFSVEDFEPNVYVSALLIKDAHLVSREDYLPGRAFGVTVVRVRPEPFLHTVSLNVPETIQPNSTMTIGLQVEGAEGATYATVAAVDEGILQLTDFESPDPTSQIFAQRALGVDTFETVGWSLASSAGPGSRTGGDSDAGGGRVQMVKPVALWSGLVSVGPDGRVEIPLQVPGYRGELRVMAVTAGPARVGSAETTVTVRDPLVLQTTLPRFLTEGDAAQVPVFVSNMTGKAGEISVSLEVEEIAVGGLEVDSLRQPVSIEGAASQQLFLEEGASGTVIFAIRSDRAPSAARFTVRASGNGVSSFDTLEAPITPARAPVRRSAHVAVEPGDVLDLGPYLSGWLPGSDRSTVWLSANPYGGAFRHLSYLIQYPYGCIEQTTSSTRPLLYVSSLMENIEPDAAATGDIDALIQHGIERVASMQTAEGGFAYWPGGASPSLWPSAYATHMLLDARDQDHALPAGILDRAVSWLAEQADNTSDTSGAAYALYVLARAEQPRTATAQRRLESLPEHRKEDRLLLMAAIQQAGVRTHEAELRQPDLSPIVDVRDNNWAFYSDRRRRALTLNILEELFPGQDVGEGLAALVAGAITEGESTWYTTQELAWAVSGIGKRLASLKASLPDASLVADQQTLTPRKRGAQGTSWRLWSASRYSAMYLTVPVTDKPLYMHVVTDGVPAGESELIGGNGLMLTRSYLNGAGERIDPTRMGLGDLVYIKVTIQNIHDAPIQNIALVDRIPAGWEIENPRLGRSDLPDWASELPLWEREHMNLRDDRLEVFGTLRDSNERVVIYAVRAVTAGRFLQPAVSAEAMYAPHLWARQPGSEIEITGPWATAL